MGSPFLLRTPLKKGLGFCKGLRHNCAMKSLSVKNLFAVENTITLFLAGLFSTVIFLLVQNMMQSSLSQLRSEQRLFVISEMSSVRAKLEGAVNNSMGVLNGISAFISDHPTATQNEFSSFSKQLIDVHPQVRNVGAAPDLVIRLMYPLKGNEKAIGLDYRKNPGQRAAAERAMTTRKMSLAGPVKLVQGGMGLIGRIPVFVGTDKKTPWGLVSGVIKVQTLYELAGITNPNSEFDFAIQGQDGLGLNGAFFYGEMAKLGKDPVSLTVNVPNGVWVLYAAPKAGWLESHPKRKNYVLATVLLSLAIFMMAFVIIYFRQGKKHDQMVLNESELKFRSIFENSISSIFVLDADHNFVDSNQAGLDLLGYTREELLELNLKDVDVNVKAFSSMQSKLILAQEIIDFEHQIKRKNGSLISVLNNSRTIFNEGGEVSSVQTMLVDITDRKRAELELQESEIRFRDFAQSSAEWFWEMDENLRFSYFSDRYHEISGVPEQGLIGKTRAESGVDLSDEKVLENIETLKAHQPFRAFEHSRTRPDGSVVHMLTAGTPIFGKDGTFKGYRGTGTDITEQVLAKTKLITAMEKADKANQAKSSFLSSMSHELRTPLNAILGFAQVLNLSPKEPLTAKQEESTKQIIKGGEHLLDLINEVLNLAQIETGNVDLDIEPVHTLEVIKGCLTMVAPITTKLKVNLDGDGCFDALVQADPKRIKQILFNLMSNAVKYNREGGTVHITSANVDGNMHRISIVDTGRGIAEFKQSELFLPFSRLGAESTEIVGTGIGLTITKHLVEAMNGTIGFTSIEGQGSTFFIELPLTKVQSVKVSDIVQKEKYPSNVHIPEERKVLYIEDNPTNAVLMENILEEIPRLKLDIAATAELGLAKIMKDLPHVILMDLHLPGMSGLDALMRLKRHTETRHIPVIAVTADAMPEEIEKGMQAGFEAYVTKPFDIPKLVTLLLGVL